MLVGKTVRLKTIIGATWRYSLFIALACLSAYFINKYVLIHYFEYPAIIPALLGTALAFFIGFNNSQAYNRWWEARIIWGAIVNESRTWTRVSIHYIQNNDIAKKFVYRQIAFVYALKDNLRNDNSEYYKKYLSDSENEIIKQKQNKHNAILELQSKDLESIYKSGLIDGFKFIEFNQTINNLCNEMGKSERIRNTVFPPIYNYYTRIFVWLFIVSATIVMADSVGAFSILFGFMLGYVFLTSHNIGLTLLNPFEPLITGIPLDQITRNIEINLLEMLGKTDLPKPIEIVNNEYIL